MNENSNTTTLKVNRISAGTPFVHNRRVTVPFEVSGPWEKYFVKKEMIAEYSFAIGKFPYEILMVPFLGAILPYAFICGAEVEFPYCDGDFLNSVEELEKLFSEHDPLTEISGTISCTHVNMFVKKDAAGSLLKYEGEEMHEGGMAELLQAGSPFIGLFSGNTVSFESKYDNTVAKGRAERLAELTGTSPVFARMDYRTVLCTEELLADAGFEKEHPYRRICEALPALAGMAPCAWSKKVKRILMPFPGDVDLYRTGLYLLDGLKIAGTGVCCISFPDCPEPEEPKERKAFEQALPEPAGPALPQRAYLLGGAEGNDLTSHMETAGIIAFMKKSCPGLLITELTWEEYFEGAGKGSLSIRPGDLLLIQEEDRTGEVHRKNPRIIFDKASEKHPDFGWFAFVDLLPSGKGSACICGKEGTDGRKELERTGVLLITEKDGDGGAKDSSGMLETAAFRTGLACERLCFTTEKSVGRNERNAALYGLLEKASGKELILTDSVYGLYIGAAAGIPCAALTGEADRVLRWFNGEDGLPGFLCCTSREEGFREKVEQKRERAFCEASPEEAPWGHETEPDVSGSRGTGTYIPEETWKSFDKFRLEADKVRKEAVRRQGITDMEPLVSVIVPVYNEETYLRKCLESVISQSYRNLELICVDDGSTDSSPDILKEYASADKRIRVVKQENAGLSAARNNGIKKVHGKYIYFLDSDDWIRENHLSVLVNQMVSEDLEVCLNNVEPFISEELTGDEMTASYEHYKDYYCRTHEYPDIYTGPEILEKLLANNEYLVMVQSYMTKTDYLKKTKNTFMKDIIHEDNLFTFKHLMRAKRVGYCKEVKYQRRLAPGSIVTSGASFRHVDGYFRVFLEMNRFMQKNSFSEEEQRTAAMIQARTLHNCLVSYSDIVDEEEKKKYLLLAPQEQMLFRALVLSDQEVRLARLEKERIELQSEIRDGENERRAFASENKTLTAQNQKLVLAAGKTKEEKKQLQDKIAELNAGMKALEGRRKILEKEKAKAEEQYREVSGKYREAEERNNEVTRQKTELEEELKNLRSTRAYKGLHRLKLM